MAPGIEGSWPSGEGASNAAVVAADSTDLEPERRPDLDLEVPLEEAVLSALLMDWQFVGGCGGCSAISTESNLNAQQLCFVPFLTISPSLAHHSQKVPVFGPVAAIALPTRGSQ